MTITQLILPLPLLLAQTCATLAGIAMQDTGETGKNAGNLFAGLSTDFEHTGAGWQPYILPHYPSTLVPFTWETQNPGQGRRSLRIDSAFGLSSFPVAAKPETPMIFSFLARAEHPGDTLGIAWGTVGPGPQAWATIRPGGAWTRHKVAVTAMKGADNIIFFLTNENPPEAGHAIFIDALCLTPGEARNAAAAEYHTPPYSLGLSTQSPDNCFLSAQPVPVTATLEFLQKTDTGNNAGNNTGTDAGRARTEGWTWIVSEVAPRERELFRKPVVWNDGYATSPAISSAPVPAVAQEDKNILRAHCEVPPGQGIYRVVIVPPSITSTAAPASLPAPASASAPMPAPTHELLVVQAGFEGLPEISADPEKAFLGIHAANDWTLLRGTRQHYVNLQPGEDHRLARLHHFGARWLRLHGGRPDLTKLNAVLPDGPDAPVLYREDIARWKNVGFNILGLLEVEWKKKHNGEPWFPAHASRGGAWMSTLLPDDLSVWEHYTRTVVRGYAGLISDWEVYNEPNGQMSVDDYLPMLAAANRVAKETDPKARVMGICSTSDHGADFSTFLRQALERGAGAHLDIVSFHPYARSPEREGSQMLRQVNEQASLHTEGKPVWITEVGRMTSAAYRSHASRMDPAKALPSIEGAGWVARYMIEARRAGVARYFSYSTAQPLFAWQPWEWCPLFEYDGTPAPMFLVAGTAARLLGGARFIGEAGAGGDASGAVRAYVFERDEPVAMRFAAIWVPDETAHGRYEVTFAPSGASSLSSRPSPPPPPAATRDGVGRLCPPDQPVGISQLPVYMTWPRQTPFTEIAAALKSADWTSQGRATLATRIIPSDTRRPASLVVQAINTTREARAFTWQPGDDNSTGSGNGAGGDAMTTPVTAPPGSVADLVRLPLPERGRLRLSGIAAMLGNSKPDTGERAVRKTISLRNRVLRLQASTKKGIRESGEQMFGASDQIVSGARDGKHFEKSPVSFSARADAEALTLRVNVTKTERGWTQSRLGPSQYLMDSVELFLRTDMASADWSDRDYQRGDIKLSLAQESGGTGRKHVSVDRGREFIDAGKITFSFHDGAGNIAQPGQKGFRCEIRIPWVALKPAPGNGTVVTEAATGGGGGAGRALLGFDLGINVSESGETRAFQYMWAGGADNWARTDRWGILLLTP